ncbi:transcriptional regulator, TrmB /transcriptional regulator, MarR family [Jatrophihabitans endophyticus]|uniref:Transcriptional regulator, TrmB /transcriptional regulator, MarR family n=1 Tax=Jatrophihabitans endophyticus TaxID=1206085 RepID=A0A1M5D6A9_9ACTN|nr:MarR family transcriptional regulator [Jatrophihabitans endophyticus]SHF62405.1 transcriptional regulator, TrmB /transcriptional regulator, MarR family [Jatrophihabitans endophyticus]
MTDLPQAGLAEDASLALEDQLCFALYAASRAMTARYRPVLDELGLTYPQYLVMIVLWDDGTSTVSHIGERLRLDSGTLSPLLKRLEARELIRRARRTDDERSVDISLTDAGLALRDRAQFVPQRISRLLSDIDISRLRGQLRTLENRLADLT